MRFRQKGFTLIELLIVIAIIGILGAVLISMINPAQQQRKAEVASIETDLRKIAEGAEAYGATFGTYSRVNSNGVPNGGDSNNLGTCWGYWNNPGGAGATLGRYAKGGVPLDPSNTAYRGRCFRTWFCVDGTATALDGVNRRWRYHSDVGRVEGPNVSCF